jgi:hypothetical protein
MRAFDKANTMDFHRLNQSSWQEVTMLKKTHMLQLPIRPLSTETKLKVAAEQTLWFVLARVLALANSEETTST